MEHEILYAGTREALAELVKARIADGWSVLGEVTILEPRFESNIAEAPAFVYFAQSVIKHDLGEWQVDTQTGQRFRRVG